MSPTVGGTGWATSVWTVTGVKGSRSASATVRLVVPSPDAVQPEVAVAPTAHRTSAVSAGSTTLSRACWMSCAQPPGTSCQ